MKYLSLVQQHLLCVQMQLLTRQCDPIQSAAHCFWNSIFFQLNQLKLKSQFSLFCEKFTFAPSTFVSGNSKQSHEIKSCCVYVYVSIFLSIYLSVSQSVCVHFSTPILFTLTAKKVLRYFFFFLFGTFFTFLCTKLNYFWETE